VVWLLVAVPTFWSFSYAITRGSDLWWHLAAGRWTLAHGAIPLLDPYSFVAAGRPWLNDAWLSDVVFHLWATGFGLYALAWWKWAVVIGTFLLLLATLMRLSEGDGCAAYLASLLAIAVSAPFLDMRPQLYSCLGFVVFLALTLDRTRAWWGLPVLFVVWVNLHAGVVLGVLCLPIVLVPPLVASDRDGRRRVLLIAALAVGACLLNPHHVAVLTRPLRYALDPTSPFRSIGEWQPPFRAGGQQSPVYPYAIGAFVLAAASLVGRRWLTGGWRRVRTLPPATWVGLALGAVTLLMSLRSRRFIPFFAIAATVAVAPALHEVLAAVRARVPRVLPPLAAAIAGVVWLAPYPQASYAFHYLTAEDTFPIATADFIETNHLEGDVFAYYNWGGYLHYRTDGRLRVFIDGRADMVFDDDTYRRYVAVLALAPGWLGVIEDSGARWVLWPRHKPAMMTALLETGRWRAVFEDAVSILLVRADGMPDQPLVPPPPSPYLDLAFGLHRFERNRPAEALPYLARAHAAAPFMKLACELLAKAQAAAGEVAAGRVTIRLCDDVFPFPGRRSRFEAYVRQVTPRGAS
jgi:hypothetical protein